MFEYQDGQVQQDQSLHQSFSSTNPFDSSSGLTTAAFVTGIVACLFNGLLITAPIGLIFSLVAFILGLIAFVRLKQYSGLVLSLISFLILMIWAASLLVIVWMDPTISFNLWLT